MNHRQHRTYYVHPATNAAFWIGWAATVAACCLGLADTNTATVTALLIAGAVVFVGSLGTHMVQARRRLLRNAP